MLLIEIVCFTKFSSMPITFLNNIKVCLSTRVGKQTLHKQINIKYIIYLFSHILSDYYNFFTYYVVIFKVLLIVCNIRGHGSAILRNFSNIRFIMNKL